MAAASTSGPLDTEWWKGTSDDANASSPFYQGCSEIFVGGGWGGVYSFYRRVLDGVEENQKKGHQYCLMEQSGRIGGRTYSVPIDPHHTHGTRFVVDVGAYRFSPDMHLVGDLILHQLQLPTECYEPSCPSAKVDFPEPFQFNFSAPLRRIVDPDTGLPGGYVTALHRMVETCRRLGARVFLNTRLVQLNVQDKKETDEDGSKTVHLEFENTLTGERSFIQSNTALGSTHNSNNDDDNNTLNVLVLNLPRNHLFQVQGVRESLDPYVEQALECIVFDVPADIFGKDKANAMEKLKHQVTHFGKAYLYYDTAWWRTILNQTQGIWPPSAALWAVNTTQGIMLDLHWHDGPVQCDSNTAVQREQRQQTTMSLTNRSLASCQGFLQIYYSMSNETFYSSIPKLPDHHSANAATDPLGVVWNTDGPLARMKLQQTHNAVMEVLQPLFNQTPALWNVSRTLTPPTGLIVGMWHRPNPAHPMGTGLTSPTKVYYDSSLSGTPDRACGGLPGLTDQVYRDLALQPFATVAAATAVMAAPPAPVVSHNTRSHWSSTLSSSSSPHIFLVNNDYVCINVRHFWGDWAEESLLQAERAMYVLGTPKPSWLNDTYYQEHVVQRTNAKVPPSSSSSYSKKTTRSDVSGTLQLRASMGVLLEKESNIVDMSSWFNTWTSGSTSIAVGSSGLWCMSLLGGVMVMIIVARGCRWCSEGKKSSIQRRRTRS